MENILNYRPYLWKMFQLKLSNSVQIRTIRLNYWQEKTLSATKLFFLSFLFINMGVFCVLIAGVVILPENFEDIFDGISVLGLGVNQLFKHLMLRLNSKRLRKIISKLPQKYSAEHDKKYEFTKKLIRYRVPFMMFVTILFIGVIRNSLAHFKIHRFLFAIRFPFDTSNFGLYCTCVAWNFIFGNVYLPGTVLNENIIFGLISVLIVELQKLNDDISELKIKFQKFTKTRLDLSNLKLLKILGKNVQDNSRSQQIIKIIKRHVQLLDIRDELEDIFGPIFLLNLICGSLCLCFEEFHSIITESLSQKIVLFIMGITQCLAIFVQCYYCQQLKDASLSISEAVYDCKWEEIEDVKVKKHLLMILMRSQKSKTLTCWKFAENSFELFGSVRFF